MMATYKEDHIKSYMGTKDTIDISSSTPWLANKSEVRNKMAFHLKTQNQVTLTFMVFPKSYHHWLHVHGTDGLCCFSLTNLSVEFLMQSYAVLPFVLVTVLIAE